MLFNEGTNNYSTIAGQWDRSHIQSKGGWSGSLNVEHLTKSRGQDLSVKWELPRAYPVEEVLWGALHGEEGNTCRRKGMCPNQEVRGSMVET